VNDGSEGADVTSAGKVFHIFAAALGKARSPIVLCFDRGTTRTAVDVDRSRRLESTSDVYVSPMVNVISGFGIGLSQYADDTQLYISLKDEGAISAV